MTTTAPALESYVGGRWQPGTDAGTTVVDTVTGQPHEVEAFGPVSTFMPYDGVGDVVALLARGEGSLVAGQEEAGMRAVLNHMQRTAAQGSPAALEAVCR